MEPEYIAQNADGLTGDAALDWFKQCSVEANSKGCTHGRYTIHPEHGWLLVEGWNVAPRVDGELREGEPRWQVTSKSISQ